MTWFTFTTDKDEITLLQDWIRLMTATGAPEELILFRDRIHLSKFYLPPIAAVIARDFLSENNATACDKPDLSSITPEGSNFETATRFYS
jgi:hypothetical protein